MRQCRTFKCPAAILEVLTDAPGWPAAVVLVELSKSSGHPCRLERLTPRVPLGYVIPISGPSRVLWPEQGLTKLDLARYTAEVGDAFISANGDRPVSLQGFRGTSTANSSFPRIRRKGRPTTFGP